MGEQYGKVVRLLGSYVGILDDNDRRIGVRVLLSNGTQRDLRDGDTMQVMLSYKGTELEVTSAEG